MGRGPTNENTNMYFQARKKAATYNERLWSREGAAELLGISVSTLADYELGNTKVVPVDKVVLMADLYNAPELITGYCMRECPVHGFLPLATEEKSLEGIALRLLQNFNEDSLKNMRDSLIEITADGKITKDELPALEKIVGQLEKMAEVISEMAEAESEGVKGKALVMLVVLNRVWSNEFPDTIEEVIFQKNQFSPVANGRYDAVEPDEECYEALKLIQVDHWNESQDALYFESKSDSKWHSENLEFLFKYGKHYFYK